MNLNLDLTVVDDVIEVEVLATLADLLGSQFFVLLVIPWARPRDAVFHIADDDFVGACFGFDFDRALGIKDADVGTDRHIDGLDVGSCVSNGGCAFACCNQLLMDAICLTELGATIGEARAKGDFDRIGRAFANHVENHDITRLGLDDLVHQILGGFERMAIGRKDKVIGGDANFLCRAIGRNRKDNESRVLFKVELFANDFWDRFGDESEESNGREACRFGGCCLGCRGVGG